MDLQKLNVPLRRPDPPEVWRARFDELGPFWEALNDCHCGFAYDAEALSEGAGDFLVAVFGALGIGR